MIAWQNVVSTTRNCTAWNNAGCNITSPTIQPPQVVIDTAAANNRTVNIGWRNVNNAISCTPGAPICWGVGAQRNFTENQTWFAVQSEPVYAWRFVWDMGGVFPRCDQIFATYCQGEWCRATRHLNTSVFQGSGVPYSHRAYRFGHINAVGERSARYNQPGQNWLPSPAGWPSPTTVNTNVYRGGLLGVGIPGMWQNNPATNCRLPNEPQ